MVENNNSFTDVNSLFQKQNVSEIEDVERQIRSDIEKKKQDLREMVGERYRDLINAADTIQDMRKITGELLSDIQDISNVCGSFGQTSMKESPAKKTNKSTEEAFYSLATQMNLLVDTPENRSAKRKQKIPKKTKSVVVTVVATFIYKIWSALDMHQYLTAAQFYLLSHYIVNSSLNINAGQLKRGSHRDIFASFPILHHQWAAISHFKPSILKGSRAALKDATLPDQEIEIMKLITHNMLTCNIKGVKNGFPFKIEAEDVQMKEADYNPEFLARMLEKLEWKALVETAKSLGHGQNLPVDISGKETELTENEDFLKELHHILLEIEVMEGFLVCPESGRKFPINKGIPNMLLKEDEV